MTTSFKVQLIRPNALDQNSPYLFFEMKPNARFNFKDNIASGIASVKNYAITDEFVRLESRNPNVYHDVHKVTNADDMYLLVESDNFEDSPPTATIHTQNEIIKILTESDNEDRLVHVSEL